jgi:hypothetical protein
MGRRRAWQLEIRTIDGAILTQDRIDASGQFYNSAIDFIGPLLNQAGLTYSASSWMSDEDDTEWIVPLQRLDSGFFKRP